MRALQALQPELKAIQARYKDDKQRQQREMMDFYKRNEINPLASCWPLLLQLPIFIALFYLLRGDEFTTEIHGAGWLGIENLSDPATGTTLIILLILYVATMVGSTSIMAASAEGPQRIMMFALPVIFVPFIINFPAGPRRLLDHDEPLDDGPAGGGEEAHPGAGQADAGGGGRDEEAAAPAAQEEAPQVIAASAQE